VHRYLYSEQRSLRECTVKRGSLHGTEAPRAAARQNTGERERKENEQQEKESNEEEDRQATAAQATWTRAF
jgi:hypothetical protein